MSSYRVKSVIGSFVYHFPLPPAVSPPIDVSREMFALLLKRLRANGLAPVLVNPESQELLILPTISGAEDQGVVKQLFESSLQEALALASELGIAENTEPPFPNRESTPARRLGSAST
jgi:hypothetical protein